MQSDESSSCSICECLCGQNSTRGEILSLLSNGCCCQRIQRHLNLRSLCKCHPQGHSHHDDVSESLMCLSPSAADWRRLPLHITHHELCQTEGARYLMYWVNVACPGETGSRMLDIPDVIYGNKTDYWELIAGHTSAAVWNKAKEKSVNV